MSIRINPAPRTFRLAGLDFDLRATLALVAVTLLLSAGYYYQPFTGSTTESRMLGQALENTLLYFVIPFFIVVLGYRDPVRDYGIRLGDWRQGLLWTTAIALLAVPILAAAARTPAMRAYYESYRGPWQRLLPTFALDMLGWEFIFRGFLIFSLVRLMGPAAIFAQAVPFALAHLGKPPLETMSTIFGGALFGWVAWRTRSFLYPYVIHLVIFSLTVLFATGVLP